MKAVRMMLGHTQDTFGALIDRNVKDIWRWENNINAPRAEIVVQIAHHLGVTTDYLLGVSDDPTPTRASSDLTAHEQSVIDAMRRGDKLRAINAIINDTMAYKPPHEDS